MLVNSLLILLSSKLLVSTLLHEKSFGLDSADASIYSMALYNDSLLITSTNDVVQKDIETGSVQRRFMAHSGQARSIVVVNGSTMITAGWDDMIIVWDLLTGSIVRRIPLGAQGTLPSSIQLVENNLFVCGSDGMVRMVNMITGRVVQTINVNAAANAIVVENGFFYVGKFGLASHLEKYSVTTRSLQLRYVGHRNSVETLLLWEGMLFSGSIDTNIICWDKESGQIILMYEGQTGPIQVIAIFENFLYSAGPETIIIKWSIDSGIVEKTFPALHSINIRCFEFYEGTLFSGSIDTTVIRWNPITASALYTYGGRNIKLRSVVLWKSFVIASGDNGVIRFEDKSQNSIAPLEIISGHPTGGVLSLLVRDDTLFSGGVDSTIRGRSLLDYTDLKIYYGHSSGVSTLDLDERYLYSGSYDYTLKRWNISSGEIDIEYVGHIDLVKTIKLKQENLASCSQDNTIRLWDKEKAIIIHFFGYPQDVITININGDNIVVGTFGVDLISIATRQLLLRLGESSSCVAIVTTTFRVYTGHNDGFIRGRDPASLTIVETFQGHKDIVMSLCVDDVGILFSTGFDGSVKKWNMASRRVSFSYEYRNGSVTALTALSRILFVGTRQGLINSFDIENAYIIESVTIHKSVVTSLISFDGTVYSSGMDGLIFEFNPTDAKKVENVFDSGYLSVTSMAVNTLHIIAVKDDSVIVILGRMNSTGSAKNVFSPMPLVSIAASDEMIFGGSRAGSIIAWTTTSWQVMFSLEDHTSQVNFLLVKGSSLFSASNDKTIIKWSLEQRASSVVFKRLSAAALGHLGPVNSISVCSDTLFSAGSDLTTRRWNTITGRHEDVYFGPTKSVTSVVCYNRSVFAGSEDFSVLMYSPRLLEEDEDQTTSQTSTNYRRNARTRVALRSGLSNSETTQTLVLIGGILAAVITAVALSIAYFYWSSKVSGKQIGKGVIDTQGFSDHMTDLETVVNTVIGISKHAAYLVANSSVASIKKLTTGGGGEIYLARVMTAFLKEKTGNLVIQKIVFIKKQMAEEAFFQEVGIMIMLSSFPNFCRIIAYTEKPASIILQYYPDGSLQDYIEDKKYGRDVIVKVSKKISSALRIMHSYFLAHCDIKTQNVLIEVIDGVPSCYLTDFGITQVLSDKILASRDFHVINLRGLSVFYAAPEAFKWFRTKSFVGVDFTKFDIYSFACIIFELLTRKTPWN